MLLLVVLITLVATLALGHAVRPRLLAPAALVALAACSAASSKVSGSPASDDGAPNPSSEGGVERADGGTAPEGTDGATSPASECPSSLSSGFAPAPTPFTVPAARCQTSFDQAADEEDALTYATLALTGNALPDLVVFQDMCDATVGQTHWDVYPWGASGFAASPRAFTVPAPRCMTSFNAEAQDDRVSYATMDITGDIHPDLVVFQDMCDATVGQTHWDVYPWSSGGFAASPNAFRVPAPRCQTNFEASAQGGSLAYSTMDITGDGHPDLVVFKDMCDATVGQTHWDVYPWTASGFAASPSPFAIPAPRCQTDFDSSAGGDSIAYATMDVTGDEHADLVVFKDKCDTTVGQTHWDVYPWSSNGFAATPSAFTVPAPRCKTNFDASSRDDAVTFSSMDVTGDGHVDLIVFQDMCDATVGQTHWDVYPWSASGFAAVPSTFAVPAPRCQASFNAAAGDDTTSYATMRLTDTCNVDLVVFQDQCDSTVGATHWDLYSQAR